MKPVLASLAGAFLFAAAGASADTVVVSTADMQGWVIQITSADGTADFVDGPATPPAGAGSIHVHTGTNGDDSVQLRNPDYAGTRLDTLTSLEYWTYTVQWNVVVGGGQVPYVILSLDHDGNGASDDLLFFEPEYQSGAYRPDIPVQGPNVLNVWREWNARIGGWWSLNGYAGAGPGANVKTIDEYLAFVPDATIVNTSSGLGGLRIVSGFASPSDVFESHVDAVTIGVGGDERTFDFENLLPVTVDLRPGTTDSQVNTNAKQLVPIAILGTASFDPSSEVDISSVTAEGAPALETKFDVGDENGDGFTDLTLYFRARSMDKPTQAECDDPNAQITVRGFLYSGRPFEGQDDVTWVGPDCN